MQGKEHCMTQAYMSQDQILDLGRAWADAERRADAARLDALLDPDFMCVGPLGFVLNKQQYLAGRRSGDLKQQAFEWQDVSVRIYGNTAIAIGTQVHTATYQGHDASGRFRGTHIYARQGDGWVLASLHLSPITLPPAWAGASRASGRGTDDVR
jgi:ketosteroid isomerase-like protein